MGVVACLFSPLQICTCDHTSAMHTHHCTHIRDIYFELLDTHGNVFLLWGYLIKGTQSFNQCWRCYFQSKQRQRAAQSLQQFFFPSCFTALELFNQKSSPFCGFCVDATAEKTKTASSIQPSAMCNNEEPVSHDPCYENGCGG